MKIEVGKSYRTRDGRRVDITQVNPNYNYPVVGVMGEMTKQWKLDGTWSRSGNETPLDLIAPWEEQPNAETLDAIDEAHAMLSAREVISERSTTHGDFSVNASVSQAIKEALRAAPNWLFMLPEQREACDHIAGKLGRIAAGDALFADHWLDVMGYARLALDAAKAADNGD